MIVQNYVCGRRTGSGMEVIGGELRLGAEREAVPQARRFLAAELSGSPPPLVEDAMLVGTELVTNALLHAGPPITLRVRYRDEAVVVEVADTSRQTPIRARESTDAMTGRGLALVAALSETWGVHATASGKVVWAELAAQRRLHPESEVPAEPEIDAEELLAAWADEVAAEPTFTIRLGDVPTDLLLDAKAHVDNLVREFSLVTAGAASGQAGQVPPHIAALVEAVVHRFQTARLAIKRQALEAAARGEPRTQLTLTLPLSAAAAGEEYLAALDDADGYARAARLLTLETPPAHRVFRRWYVGAIVEQLRRRAAGEVPEPPETFEHRLLAELATVAAAQRASDRAARLQSVTSALAAANTVAEVADVIISEGVAALGATGGALFAVDRDKVEVPAAVGFGAELVERLRAEQADEDLPAMVAARTGRPVWIESVRDRDERFPGFSDFEPGTVSLCAAPLTSGGRTLGALRMSFSQPRLFDEDEQQFVLALAAQAAQAMVRSELYAAERAARADAERLAGHLTETARRLGLLQKVTADLTGATSPEQIAEIVVENAADAFGADTARVYLLGDDSMLRAIAARGEERLAGVWQSFSPDADVPGAVALRAGAPLVIEGQAELAARFPALSSVYADERRLLVAPLIVGDHRLGVLSLTFVTERSVSEQTQLTFLTTLADACAQALERSLVTARAMAATEKLAFLAEASVVLSSSIDYRTTLANVARLVVPRLADWCLVQVVEDGHLQTLAVAHADPDKAEWAQRLQQRFPVDPAADRGVAQVVRTGVAELYPEVSPELLEDSARDREHLQVLQAAGMRSVIIAPLTDHTGTFGALTLISAESGRRYGDEDRAFAEDLARRAAIAVGTAHAFHEQSGRLAAVTRVAAAAQHAILAPVPARVGPVALAARYVSAAAEALIGGDLYEVVERPGAVRLLIGDVRGKGLEAVRTATVVLGEFRAAAADRVDLTDVAVQMDRRVAPYLTDEDFVTALLAEIGHDGWLTVASCGHPPALLTTEQGLVEVGSSGSLPLGLGATPTAERHHLVPGQRLLLYTDGMLEARDPAGRFVDLRAVVGALDDGNLDGALDRMLDALQRAVGGELGDDLALLVAEYRPI